jgi:hypothetical protein
MDLSTWWNVTCTSSTTHLKQITCSESVVSFLQCLSIRKRIKNRLKTLYIPPPIGMKWFDSLSYFYAEQEYPPSTCLPVARNNHQISVDLLCHMLNHVTTMATSSLTSHKTCQTTVEFQHDTNQARTDSTKYLPKTLQLVRDLVETH